MTLRNTRFSYWLWITVRLYRSLWPRTLCSSRSCLDCVWWVAFVEDEIPTQSSFNWLTVHYGVLPDDLAADAAHPGDGESLSPRLCCARVLDSRRKSFAFGGKGSYVPSRCLGRVVPYLFLVRVLWSSRSRWLSAQRNGVARQLLCGAQHAVRGSVWRGLLDQTEGRQYYISGRDSAGAVSGMSGRGEDGFD